MSSPIYLCPNSFSQNSFPNFSLITPPLFIFQKCLLKFGVEDLAFNLVDGDELSVDLAGGEGHELCKGAARTTRTSSSSSMSALRYAPGRSTTATSRFLAASMEAVMKTESIATVREADSSFSIIPRYLRPSAQKRPFRDSSRFFLDGHDGFECHLLLLVCGLRDVLGGKDAWLWNCLSSLPTVTSTRPG